MVRQHISRQHVNKPTAVVKLRYSVSFPSEERERGTHDSERGDEDVVEESVIESQAVSLRRAIPCHANREDRVGLHESLVPSQDGTGGRTWFVPE